MKKGILIEKGSLTQPATLTTKLVTLDSSLILPAGSSSKSDLERYATLKREIRDREELLETLKPLATQELISKSGKFSCASFKASIIVKETYNPSETTQALQAKLEKLESTIYAKKKALLDKIQVLEASIALDKMDLEKKIKASETADKKDASLLKSRTETLRIDLV